MKYYKFSNFNSLFQVSWLIYFQRLKKFYMFCLLYVRRPFRSRNLNSFMPARSTIGNFCTWTLIPQLCWFIRLESRCLMLCYTSRPCVFYKDIERRSVVLISKQRKSPREQGIYQIWNFDSQQCHIVESCTCKTLAVLLQQNILWLSITPYVTFSFQTSHTLLAL